MSSWSFLRTMMSLKRRNMRRTTMTMKGKRMRMRKRRKRLPKKTRILLLSPRPKNERLSKLRMAMRKRKWRLRKTKKMKAPKSRTPKMRSPTGRNMMSRPPRQRKSVSRVRPLKQRRATMFLRRLGPKTPKLKSDIESLNRSLKLLCLCCPPCSIPKVGQDSEPLAAAGKGGFSTLYHRSLVTSIVLGV
ncbi:hypothetical protein M433DRAFT_170762 [Acidomyces richmondensis BFW]|nr:MAG: hypothetical protein FE78DRAFT_35895 [Acidomyces sp. 'richmondensis']KYG50180.1 hypothetical protein M433DRAFT_170762 [Acidomyces richmondensis BFW]